MKFKNLLLSVFALGATALTAFSQGTPNIGQYTVKSLSLPMSTLSQAAGTTNLIAGWSSVISVTNTSITWSNTVFVTNTTVVSSTNTVYADMSILNQKDLAVIVSETAGIGTNVYTFAFGLDSSTVDTNNTKTITVNHPAASTTTASANWKRDDIGGFGVARLITITWTGIGSAAWTNGFQKYAIKQNAW